MPIDFSNAWKAGVKIINEAISLLPMSSWRSHAMLFTSPVAVESTAAKR